RSSFDSAKSGIDHLQEAFDTAVPSVRLLVEEIVGAIGDQRLLPGVRWRSARTGLRRDASLGVQALDERRVGQPASAPWSSLGRSHRQEQPRNRVLPDECRVSGGLRRGNRVVGPHGARVAGVLPRWTLAATLLRVGTVEVGDDLLAVLVVGV